MIKCHVTSISQAQSCTLEKVLIMLREVLTDEGPLSQHGPRLAAQLANLFTQSQLTSSMGVNGGTNSPVRKLILEIWKL